MMCTQLKIMKRTPFGYVESKEASFRRISHTRLDNLTGKMFKDGFGGYYHSPRRCDSGIRSTLSRLSGFAPDYCKPMRAFAAYQKHSLVPKLRPITADIGGQREREASMSLSGSIRVDTKRADHELPSNNKSVHSAEPRPSGTQRTSCGTSYMKAPGTRFRR